MCGRKNDLHGVLHQKILVDQLVREYMLYMPANLRAEAPLVLVCHGYTDHAENMMQQVAMNGIADEHGFAVCYPQGWTDSKGNTFWEVGYTFTADRNINDVKFLSTAKRDDNY